MNHFLLEIKMHLNAQLIQGRSLSIYRFMNFSDVD